MKQKKIFIRALGVFVIALMVYIYSLVSDEPVNPQIIDAMGLVIGIL